MKKLYMLTAAAGVLLAFASPSLAASRVHASPGYDVNTVRTYGDRDSSNPPYAHRPGYNAYNRALEGQYQYAPSQNQPYVDNAYGEPNGW
jgi:hypothetical protein